MYSLCLTLFVIISYCDTQTAKPIDIHIGALFDLRYSSLSNGRDELRAAELAIEDINAQTKDLFQGRYRLRLLSNNSQV